MKIEEVTLAFSGASGALYGLRLLEQLVLAGVTLSVVMPSAGRSMIRSETDFQLPEQPADMADYLSEHFEAQSDQIKVYSTLWDNPQSISPVASGEHAPKTMIVCPCSTASLASIAVGISHDLLERSAEVVLKEKGNLVLVVREMPLSPIHLEHMLSLARLGVCIMPASPGFYSMPKRVGELVDFVVARILDQINVPHQLRSSDRLSAN